LAQAIFFKDAGQQVGLEVEFGQLCLHPFVLLHQLEHFHRDGSRLVGLVVDQAHFLLGADADNIAFKPVVFKHVLERLYVAQKIADEVLHSRFILYDRYSLFAHVAVS
jgi:hypothetical protein